MVSNLKPKEAVISVTYRDRLGARHKVTGNTLELELIIEGDGTKHGSARVNGNIYVPHRIEGIVYGNPPRKLKLDI